MTKDSHHLLGVYSIVSDEDGHDLQVEIGYATQHPDGRGFDLTLRALPLTSKLVLRELEQDGSRHQSHEESQNRVRENSGESQSEDSQAESQDHPADNGTVSLASQMREFERAAIQQCLLETGGSIGAALKRLKIPRRTLNEKMVRLGIDRRSLKPLSRSSNAANAESARPGSESAVLLGGEPHLFLGQSRSGKNGATNGQ
jgi:Bacterial regulatory protein, Fis family